MSEFAPKGEPNVPDWQEDANSPVSEADSSVTVTLSETYDLVAVFVLVDVGGSTFVTTGLQVNGETEATYDYTQTSGTNTTGASEWPIGDSRGGAKVAGTVVLNGTGGPAVGLQDGPMNDHDNINSLAVTGRNDDVTTPIDSVTVNLTFESGNTVDELKVRVFGWSA